MTNDLQSPVPLVLAATAKSVATGDERGKLVPLNEAVPAGPVNPWARNSIPMEERPEPVENPELPEVDLSGVVESINDFLQSARRDLAFSFDEDSGRSIIMVLDRESQEVIRVIPPQEVLAVAAVIREQGILNSVGIRDKA